MDNLLKTSSETKSPATSDDIFTENCECINKIKFEYPLLYNENDPEQYSEVAGSKLDDYIEEVEKHSNQKPDVEKPCYKKNHTTSLLYVKSKKKHKRTLLAIRQVLNNFPSKKEMKVPFALHGIISKIDMAEYVSIMEQVCNYHILTTRGFKTPETKVEVKNYIISLKSHKSTLTHLKNLLIDVKNTKEEKIEINTPMLA